MSTGVTVYNTASRMVEPFVPLTPGVVRVYCCRPTVYHYIHIGNLRIFIFEDLVRRTLEYCGTGANRPGADPALQGLRP